MAEVVYILCSLASLLCAVLLMRGYRRSKHELLFWSAVCFIILGVANIVLVIDLVIIGTEGADLSLWRTALSLVAMSVLLYGLIFKSN
jgi:uncharacterized protein involved in response to NO